MMHSSKTLRKYPCRHLEIPPRCLHLHHYHCSPHLPALLRNCGGCAAGQRKALDVLSIECVLSPGSVSEFRNGQTKVAARRE